MEPCLHAVLLFSFITEAELEELQFTQLHTHTHHSPTATCQPAFKMNVQDTFIRALKSFSDLTEKQGDKLVELVEAAASFKI